VSIGNKQRRHLLSNIVRIISLVGGQRSGLVSEWVRLSVTSGTGPSKVGHLTVVLIRTLMGKGSRIRCSGSCRTGSTVEGRGIRREVHSITLRIIVVDVGGIELAVSRRELQTGRAATHARVIAGSTNRFVKVGVNLVFVAAALLALDEEENKGADNTKTGQGDNSKSASHGTFVF